MTEQEMVAAMAVRDLMSATISLSELSTDLVKIEAGDIELAYIRLGQMLSHIRKEHSHA
jgi:hypothetical protein